CQGSVESLCRAHRAPRRREKGHLRRHPRRVRRRERHRPRYQTPAPDRASAQAQHRRTPRAAGGSRYLPARFGNGELGNQRRAAVACAENGAAADLVTSGVRATKATAGPPKRVATTPCWGSVEKVIATDIDG